MAKHALADRRLSNPPVCRAFGISETCYRNQPKLSGENAEIAGWLVRLTHNQRNRGFGLCFLSLQRQRPSLEPEARVPHLPGA